MTVLSPLHAGILGLVEGITEYLPVSSTGHLIIVSSVLMPGQSEDAKRNLDAFQIVIQGGAILAVLGLYWDRVLQMIRGLVGKDQIGRQLALNLFVAFLPAAVIGVLLNDLIQRHLFFPAPVIAALLIGGIIMIFIGRWQRSYFHDSSDGDSDQSHRFVSIEDLSWRQALVIGAIQCIAMWPGTSRSMVTIVGGMLVGMRPKQAAEFSFLLGLPTLGGACVYSAIKNVSHDGPNMVSTFGAVPLLIGFAVATVSAAIAVRWLVHFLTRHGLALFGWYRIAIGLILAAMIWRGMITITPDAAPTISTTHLEDVSSRNPLTPRVVPPDRCSSC